MWDYLERKIGSHLIPALINSDPSGLSDEEEQRLDDFERETLGHDLCQGLAGHWSVVEDSNNFTLCDCTSLLSETEKVRYNFKLPV